MFYSLTLAMVFGLRASLAVHAIMISTLLSFVTLPLWRLLLA
jgi:predicted permease